MGIESRINMSQINSYLQERINTLDELMIRNLNYLGMECVNLAKNLDTYEDQTGNLRNSIGYVVVKHGNVLSSVFEDTASGPESGNDDRSGKDIGEDYAKELAKDFGNGYAVIVVAGMEYASYVEDIHHLDVLKPAEVLARTRINKIAQSIVNTMRRAQ